MPSDAPLLPRHWVYLDSGKTHEVHAEVEPEPVPSQGVLRTTEFPRGSKDPGEAVSAARKVTREAEVQMALRDIEERLRLAGTYFRAELSSQDRKWVPLGVALSKPPDLRAVELPIPDAARPGAKMAFHHFHGEEADRLLIDMPRMDVQEERHVLAEVSFRFPRVDQGELRVLHPRLAPPTLKSTILREHLEAPRTGFRKLVEPLDYERTFGEGWVYQARQMYRAAVDRITGRARPAGDATLLQVNRTEEPRIIAEVRRALDAPRTQALLARFLTEAELAHAGEEGEHQIRRLVQAKRRARPHSEAYEISIVEAALLLRFALGSQVWSLVDEEAQKLLRFVGGYA